MPIQFNGTALPRIKLGNEQVYRVYKGNELVWGLYNLTYNVGPGSVEQNPKTFVWGIGVSSLPTPTCTGATFDGWYLDSSLSESTIGISKNIHKDTNIYAKFIRQKTQYKVHYKVDEGHDVSDGGGSFSPRTSAPDVYSYPYNYRGAYTFQCAWYSYCRSAEISGEYPWNGYHLGGARSYYYWPWDKSQDRWDVRLGAVAAYGDAYWSGGELYSSNPHTAVVEGIDGSTVWLSDYNHMGDESFHYYSRSLSETTSKLFGINTWYGWCYNKTGGGGGSHHVENWVNYETDWQDDESYPNGEKVSVETRVVYSYWNYNTSNWTEWSIVKP